MALEDGTELDADICVLGVGKFNISTYGDSIPLLMMFKNFVEKQLKKKF